MGNSKKFYPLAMTIAGSDSGGGAGIAADLRTFNALGVFGCCAITAVTAQNPLGVSKIEAVSPDMAAEQIRQVTAAMPVKFVKTGMLFSAETVKAVAAEIKRLELYLVCDPVMVATSGARLLEESAIQAVQEELLPLAQWLTPNLPEAELLLGRKLRNQEEMRTGAMELAEKYGSAVWLKGGHLHKAMSTDVICRKGEVYTISTPELPVKGHASHGTGCTLSAALCATLALDLPWKQAVCESKAFVYGSLRECVQIGKGIEAMYPPVEDSLQLVTLEKMPGKSADREK